MSSLSFSCMCAIFPPLLFLLLCPERTIQTQRQKPRDPQKDRPTDRHRDRSQETQKESDRQTDTRDERFGTCLRIGEKSISVLA
jgi:hypothetical protein